MRRPVQRHGHGVVRTLSGGPVRTLRKKVQAQDGSHDSYAACESSILFTDSRS